MIQLLKCLQFAPVHIWNTWFGGQQLSGAEHISIVLKKGEDDINKSAYEDSFCLDVSVRLVIE